MASSGQGVQPFKQEPEGSDQAGAETASAVVVCLRLNDFRAQFSQVTSLHSAGSSSHLKTQTRVHNIIQDLSRAGEHLKLMRQTLNPAQHVPHAASVFEKFFGVKSDKS